MESARRASDAPDDIVVFLLRRAQHIEEGEGALCKAWRQFVRFVAFLAFVEVAVVFGAILFVDGDGLFELADRRIELFARDDAAFAQPLADNAEEILSEAVEHQHVGRRVAFERNQHDCSLLIF